MINILVNIPTITDAISWYRGVGPLTHLRKKWDKLQISFMKYGEWDWGTLRNADILFMMRPSTEVELQALRTARDWNIPVWLDYDDDFFSIPVDNPNYGYFSNQGVKNTLESLIKEATCVSVSTRHLQTRLQCMNDNVVVIPNAYDPILDKFRHNNKKQTSMGLWRGTRTHDRDIMEYVEPTVKATERYKGSQLAFMGYNPWFLTDKMIHSKLIFFPPLDLVGYFKSIQAIRPSYFFVPLHDSPFNRSKSNIAAIEAASCGGTALVPSWEEWNLAGVVRYKDCLSFQSGLEALISGEIDLQRSSQKLWEHVNDKYHLNTINLLRTELISRLMDISV